MEWHHVELIHLDLLRILHWAETDMDEEVTEPISVRVPGRSQGWIVAEVEPRGNVMGSFTFHR